jgi:hypothetical protein
MTPAGLARTRLLVALRLGETWSLTQLRAALRASHGSLRGAAVELGLGERTLGRLRVESPAVRAVLDRHALGRTGAAAVAHRVYLERRSGG